MIDTPRVEAAIREFLEAIGEDPLRPGLAETPARVARAAGEMLSGMNADPTDILSTTFDLGHDELVLVKAIELYSMCEHHLLPFHGQAHIGYIPSGGRITGLSKIARLVEAFSRRLQVQERLTSQIADMLEKELGAKGVIVVIEAEHLCMSMRGVRKTSTQAITSAVRGALRNAATRAEAMSLLLGR